jgi:hypothetical protein
MADITAQDGFTYYEGDENSCIVVGGFAYYDDNSFTLEEGYTYVAPTSKPKFFTFLID